MQNKPILKQKTFWGSLATIATGVGLIVSGEVPTGMQTVATGVLALFIRDALRG